MYDPADGVTTADWEWSYAGVAFGDGTTIDVNQIEGWLDLPDVRTGDLPRAGRHGMFAGQDLAAGRTVRMSLSAVDADAETLAATLEAFEAALVFATEDAVLVGALPGRGTRRLYCRPRRRAHPIRWSNIHGSDVLEVEWFATDPRIYDNTKTTVSTALPTSSGGLSFAASAPFVFGTGGTGGTMDCPNDGSFPAPWVATFTGPLVAPSLELTATGEILSFSGTLGAGETLVVDSQDRTVLLNGTTSRYSWLQQASQWFDLAPGANSVRLNGGSGAGTVQMVWRSAWL